MATVQDERAQTEQENGLVASRDLMSASMKNRKRNISKEEYAVEKYQKQSGLSWWTCLLLDIPQENRNGMKVSIYRKEEKFYNCSQKFLS